ncbi:type VI secretion protein [Paramesorhizobium deserti]|uniref:Type VI secretion protein n=1 Tax=Paramesorhizobium deserti TaxID=1494590 RepID=A0A135HXK4_9HYPH|nr:type VI secretion system contractile sheath large subunit [Paramesorhizobium deserti]KXF77934.1 type VI secretion protein [Paramesorhizobium deserti]
MSTNLSTTWRRRADRLIALIDAALNRQLNLILHHPDFQALEAGWRGLAMLVRAAVPSPQVKIKLLSTSWSELARNMQRASDFDQSHLFELIYSHEFGMPGGEPFGLLVGNYLLSPDEPADTISTLSDIGMVAASAFCPFIAGASPRIIGLESFHELNRITDVSRLADKPQYMRWNALRAREDSRFIGLVAPRVLMRAPYAPYARDRDDGFPFHETVSPDGDTLLWGNGAFAFAAIVIRNFIDTGWFAEIRGVMQDGINGGLIGPDELSSYDFGTESNGLSAQPPLEVRLTSTQEQQFCDLGLIPVVGTYLSASAIFNSNQSLHAPRDYSNENARQNARLAAMLQYVLCASRFSHYLKIIMRDEIGQLSDAAAVQRKLSEWLAGYTLGNDDADLSLRTRYPLRSAGIDVEEMPGKPGSFSCTLRLQPHFQLDDFSASFHLIAKTGIAQQRPFQPASTSTGVPA